MLRRTPLKLNLLFIAAVVSMGLSLVLPLLSMSPTSATTTAQLQECYDKFTLNSKDGVIYGRLSIGDQTLLNTCRASNDCVDAGAGSLVGSRIITCTNPANTQAEQTASTNASNTRIDAIIRAVCGDPPTGQTPVGAYITCSESVPQKYNSCAYTGGGVTSNVLDSPTNIANCMVRKGINTVSVANLASAIEQGNKAADAITTAAANEQLRLDCTNKKDGSTWNDATQKCDPPAASNSKDTCGYESGALNWLACPITQLMQSAATKMTDMLQNMLFFPVGQIYGGQQEATKSLHDAWASFRTFGLGLVVIAGLAMVISQALGLEFLDAYTIRKLLPRLAIALVGIALSWPILNVLISAFNDLGLAAHNLIIGPFSKMPLVESGGTNVLANWTTLLVGGRGFALYLKFLGPVGALTLLGTVLLAIFIGVLVLGLRWVIIMLCIILAPIAIAAYVLPGTQKLWAFWKNTLLTTLFMFPIIMAFLAAGDAMARVMTAISKTGTESAPGGYFLVIMIYFAPYFMLPFAFKMAGGLMNTIFSIANDKSRGIFDRARKYRSETAKRRMGKFATGALGRDGGVAQRVAQMATLKDNNYLTRKGRQRFRNEAKNLVDNASEEHSKKAPQATAGDSDANLVGLQARSRNDFVQKYVAHRRLNGDKRSDQAIAAEAGEKMAKLQAAYGGAEVGSRAFRRAATHSHVALDNAAWDGVAGKRLAGESNAAYHLRQRLAKEKIIRQLGEDGIYEAGEFAGLERLNKLRPDNVMGSYGQHADYIDKVMKGTGAGTAADAAGAEANMYKEVAASGATMGNKRGVERVAAQMEQRLVASASGNAAALGTYTQGDSAVEEVSIPSKNLLGDGGLDTWVGEYAAAADIHETQTYSGQGNSELYADVFKEKAFTEADLPNMHPDVQVEAKKLLAAAQAAGQEVTHQDVKNQLQGNTVTFTNSSGREIAAEPASSKTVKLFTARRKEWSAAYQAKAGQPVDPSQPVLF